MLLHRASMTGRHLLLIGPPGSGKTTALRRAVALLHGMRMAGFLTVEVRCGGQRIGFEIVTLDGRTAPLASLSAPSPHRVGRYGVSIETFERLALAALAPRPEIELYVVDEIGRMECLSQRFAARVREILAGTVPLCGTVGRGSGIPAEARRHPLVALVPVTPGERDALPDRIVRWAREVIGRPRIRS